MSDGKIYTITKEERRKRENQSIISLILILGTVIILALPEVVLTELNLFEKYEKESIVALFIAQLIILNLYINEIKPFFKKVYPEEPVLIKFTFVLTVLGYILFTVLMGLEYHGIITNDEPLTQIDVIKAQSMLIVVVLTMFRYAFKTSINDTQYYDVEIKLKDSLKITISDPTDIDEIKKHIPPSVEEFEITDIKNHNE